jgi:hypothetical protein
MTPEEIDRRITELQHALPGFSPGSAELRTAHAELTTMHAARYIRHGGTEEDLRTARTLADAVLADEAVTPAERQRMSLLRVALTMVDATPAAALRGHPLLDAEALQRTDKWRDSVDPARVAAGMSRLLGQLKDIPDLESLPPEVRSYIDLVPKLVPLMNTDGAGLDQAEVVEQLETGLTQAHPDMPGRELVQLLVTWLRPAPLADRGRVAELETTLAGLPDDHLLTPVLRRDLARALMTGGPVAADRVERATRLLEQAAAGMAEDHPLHDETLRMLAGALVATAASDTSEMSLARAERVAADVLAQSRGPERQGPDRFLLSLVGLLRGMTGDERHTRAAVRDLLDAIDLLPDDHDLRPFAVGQLGALLADRHLMEGMLEDAETAHHILSRAAAAVSDDEESSTFLAGLIAVHRVNHASGVKAVDDLSAATAALREVVERLSPGQLLRSHFELVLALADLQMASWTGTDMRPAFEVVQQVVARGEFPGIPPAGVAMMTGAVAVLDGMIGADPDAVMAAIDQMESKLETSAPPVVMAMRRAMLGQAYLVAHQFGVGRDVAAGRAVGHLLEALRLLDAHRAGLARTEVMRVLASAYRLCGDREQSRRAAFEALAGQAGTVLLQTGVAHAVVTARGASTEAAALAQWCLADDDVAGAVQAVELGRGLALHAATSALELPSLLRRVGWPDLADAWVADAAARVSDPSPWTLDEAASSSDESDVDHVRAATDLRHDVLEVLRRTPEGMRLMTAPSAAAIGEALAGLDTDALVYLLPGDEHTAGHLLMIDRNGQATAVSAPALLVEPDGPPVRFQRADRSDEAAWRAALDAVCDWAGTAVLTPLLAALATGTGPARIVLVPSGLLGAVPWPAANLHNGRFACVDVVLSTAASARQFLDAATRPMLPLGLEQVLVADPLGGLPFTVDEVLALHGSCYPDATVFGDFTAVEFDAGQELPAGRGTPAEILDQLPSARSLGASLLHLGCHARTAGSAEASHLELTERLTIRAVLEHGAGRTFDAPGPLVVLSACVSDLTVHDYDEALTLATAFLAAGAVAVVGSRWPIDDLRTAIMMFAFHHFLTRVDERPADALRSAQLWMLDPQRAELPDMPEAMLGDVSEVDLTDITVWGAFTHHGR